MNKPLFDKRPQSNLSNKPSNTQNLRHNPASIQLRNNLKNSGVLKLSNNQTLRNSNQLSSSQEKNPISKISGRSIENYKINSNSQSKNKQFNKIHPEAINSKNFSSTNHYESSSNNNTINSPHMQTLQAQKKGNQIVNRKTLASKNKLNLSGNSLDKSIKSFKSNDNASNYSDSGLLRPKAVKRNILGNVNTLLKKYEDMKKISYQSVTTNKMMQSINIRSSSNSNTNAIKSKINSRNVKNIAPQQEKKLNTSARVNVSRINTNESIQKPSSSSKSNNMQIGNKENNKVIENGNPHLKNSFKQTIKSRIDYSSLGNSNSSNYNNTLNGQYCNSKDQENGNNKISKPLKQINMPMPNQEDLNIVINSPSNELNKLTKLSSIPALKISSHDLQTSDRKQIKKPHSNHLSNHKESKTKSRIDNKRIQKPKSKSNSISSNAQKTLVHSSSEKSCSIAINKEILECKFQRKKVNEIYRLTKAGVNKSKMNQDSSFIYQKFEDCVDHYYLGVCDGHGTYGAEISGFISEMLPIVLNKDLIKRRKLSRISGQEYNRIIEEAFLLVNDKILYDFDVDVNLSGSTCSSLIYTPDKVISANVGDSRCVIGKYFNGLWTSQNLTRDHKPTERDEAERIKRSNGRVEPSKDRNGNFIGPQRVWLKNDNIPGLGMTRSFGDRIGVECGIIAKPEIMEWALAIEDKFIIIASDGVWEVMDSEECINIVKDFYIQNEIKMACEYLINECSKRWMKEEGVVDDITIILIFFEN